MKIYKTNIEMQQDSSKKQADVAWCEEDKLYYKFEDDVWQNIKSLTPEDETNQEDNKINQPQVNLYELNKMLINQMKPLDKKVLNDKKQIIKNLHKTTNNNHYMLLCKDYNYYTLFESESILRKSFEDLVIDIVSNLGEVYSIDETADQVALEIWVKPEGETMPLAFYLFPYDQGVVYYG